MAREGESVTYQCMAAANPPVEPNSYEWFLDDHKIPRQFGPFLQIDNVTRSYQDRQLKCKAENELGVAKGVRSIQVQCKLKT